MSDGIEITLTGPRVWTVPAGMSVQMFAEQQHLGRLHRLSDKLHSRYTSCPYCRRIYRGPENQCDGCGAPRTKPLSH